MTPNLLHRVSSLTVCATVGLFSSATPVLAQFDAGAPSQATALSAAAKASPKLVKELAKELESTPEQAAGAAGVIFGIAKSFLPPEDFAKVAKAVPGMDALLAAVPVDPVGTSGEPALGPTLTTGFASPSAASPTPGASTPGMTMALPAGMGSMIGAIGGLSKLGIKPEMIAKAVPFLSGYLKKHGGEAVGALLGGVFKGK